MNDFFHNNKEIHDGSWALKQLPPEARIDWENHYRDETEALFGREFYIKQLLQRAVHAVQQKNQMKDKR